MTAMSSEDLRNLFTADELIQFVVDEYRSGNEYGSIFPADVIVYCSEETDEVSLGDVLTALADEDTEPRCPRCGSAVYQYAMGQLPGPVARVECQECGQMWGHER